MGCDGEAGSVSRQGMGLGYVTRHSDTAPRDSSRGGHCAAGTSVQERTITNIDRPNARLIIRRRALNDAFMRRLMSSRSGIGMSSQGSTHRIAS